MVRCEQNKLPRVACFVSIIRIRDFVYTCGAKTTRSYRESSPCFLISDKLHGLGSYGRIPARFVRCTPNISVSCTQFHPRRILFSSSQEPSKRSPNGAVRKRIREGRTVTDPNSILATFEIVWSQVSQVRLSCPTKWHPIKWDCVAGRVMGTFFSDVDCPAWSQVSQVRLSCPTKWDPIKWDCVAGRVMGTFFSDVDCP